MAYRDYSTALGRIVDTTGKGDFSTIVAAITAASTGQTIFIRPGTYTENLTLKAGVNLTAYNCDATSSNVIILGKCTFTAAGTVSISGIQLKTNSDFCLAVTGSAASIVYLINCNINGINNTPISYTSSSGSSNIYMLYCTGDLGTTGLQFITQSSAGNSSLNYSQITNTGASTTASAISAGQFSMKFSLLQNPVTTSSTAGLSLVNASFDTSAINVTGLTVGGSGGNNISLCLFSSGTASAVSISGSATMNLCSVNSSNTNAITGVGTLVNDGIAFSGTSSTINTTTVTSRTFSAGTINGVSLRAFSTTLTSAQVKAAHGTPIQLVAAVTGLTYVVVSYRMAMIYGGTNVFTAAASQTLALYYGTTVSVATGLTNASIVASASRVDIGQGSIAASQTLAATRNVALNIYNPIATEITGNAANDNTVVVDGFYYIA